MMRCCKYCGALLEDEAKVCDFCGAVLENTPNVIPAPQEPPAVIPIPSEESEVTVPPTPKKKLSKKTVLICVGVVLALIAIAVAVNMLFFNPHVAVDRYETVINGEFNKLKDLAPKEYWAYIAEQNNTTVDKYIAERIKSLEESHSQALTQETSYGTALSAEIHVVDTYKVSAMHLAGIKKALESKYGIEGHRIKSAYKLHLKVIQNYTKDCIDYAGLVTAVQIDSQWYLIRYTSNPDSYYVSFITNGSLAALLAYY